MSATVAASTPRARKTSIAAASRSSRRSAGGFTTRRARGCVTKFTSSRLDPLTRGQCRTDRGSVKQEVRAMATEERIGAAIHPQVMEAVDDVLGVLYAPDRP